MMSNEERHSELPITCPYCNQRQVVHLQVKVPSFAQVSGQMVSCVKCQHEFEVPRLAQIIAGPFASER